jgi:hypothetical protein
MGNRVKDMAFSLFRCNLFHFAMYVLALETLKESDTKTGMDDCIEVDAWR